MRILLRLFSMAAMNFQRNLITPNEAGLTHAAQLLKTGQLLAFPTETVYGLGADATNVEAVINIFKAKGRPLTDPLIVHVAKPADADSLIELGGEEKRVFSLLSENFWPGPLTQIVKASARIPAAVTANTGFVGIRCPKHRLALALLERAQVPVAAPSANRFGHVSPTRAAHVLADLAEKGVMVLDGESVAEDIVCASDPCEFGIESTVVKLEGSSRELIIFRQGAVTQYDIEALFRRENIDWTIKAMVRTVKMHAVPEHNAAPSSGSSENENAPVAQDEGDSGKDTSAVGQVAPGQAVTHYAPDIPCYLLSRIQPSTSSSSSSDALAVPENTHLFHMTPQQIQEKVVLIDFGQQYASWQSQVFAYRDLSTSGDANEAARNLFDTLRWSETQTGAEYVLIAPVLLTRNSKPEEIVGGDMSLGVADRVFRAASGLSAILSVQQNA